MKNKILIILLIFVIIFYFTINVLNNNLQKEQYKPPVCGNNICERGEEFYCLDCNLSCKSELCNSKINILCDNCTETQEKLLPTLFEHQTIVYDCLTDYYGYNSPRLIYHTISNMNIPNESCSKKDGCYVSGGGFSEIEGIKQGLIPGLREYGKSDVTKKENVGFELHEIAHAFTYYNLGTVPSWFTEGISLYTEGRILCHSEQVLSNIMDDSLPLYEKLKKNNINLNEIMPDDEDYQIKYSSHRIGALYFLALEQNYDCDNECIAEILFSLHKYKENCVGECFENAKESVPQLMNFSLNNKDLRIQFITNEIIKQKSEKVIGEDLTSLFEMLEIEY